MSDNFLFIHKDINFNFEIYMIVFFQLRQNYVTHEWVRPSLTKWLFGIAAWRFLDQGRGDFFFSNLKFNLLKICKK